MNVEAMHPKMLVDAKGAIFISCEVRGRKEVIEQELNRLEIVEKDRGLELTLKQRRKRRSLDANAYAWVLIGKLAELLRLSPREVYRQAIQDIGGNYIILPIRQDAVSAWMEIWEARGTGWIARELGESKLDGYINVMNYYGSSVYDSKQMSRLIDRLADDCREQGIETMPDRELRQLAESWSGKERRKHD